LYFNSSRGGSRKHFPGKIESIVKCIGGGGGRGEAEGARVPPAIIIDIDHISSIAGYTGSNILFEMPDLPALLLKLDFLECMPPRLTSII